MEANPVIEQQHETTGMSPVPATQVGRMRAAIDKAVAVAPSFLRGDVDANHMTNTMVQAVRTYLEQEQAAGNDGTPQSAEAQGLQRTLAELMGCGSGFQAHRCDAACVARTMTQMVHEFGAP